MNISTRQLQENAAQALADLVKAFDEHFDQQVKERSRHDEYVDATEILIACGKQLMDDIFALLMEHGAWMPSSIDELLREGAGSFGGGFYQNQGGWAAEGQTAEDSAYKGRTKLHEALAEFKRILTERGFTVPE